MIEQQREKFEFACEEAGGLPWGYLAIRRSETGYSIYPYNVMWWAWQAAIASFEITLPAPATEIIPGARYYFNDDVVMTLEAAGVGVKS